MLLPPHLRATSQTSLFLVVEAKVGWNIVSLAQHQQLQSGTAVVDGEAEGAVQFADVPILGELVGGHVAGDLPQASPQGPGVGDLRGVVAGLEAVAGQAVPVSLPGHQGTAGVRGPHRLSTGVVRLRVVQVADDQRAGAPAAGRRQRLRVQRPGAQSRGEEDPAAGADGELLQAAPPPRHEGLLAQAPAEVQAKYRGHHGDAEAVLLGTEGLVPGSRGGIRVRSAAEEPERVLVAPLWQSFTVVEPRGDVNGQRGHRHGHRGEGHEVRDGRGPSEVRPVVDHLQDLRGGPRGQGAPLLLGDAPIH
mmetsp:Transcript_11860/g.31678  ORF Transcript_11860/g.31678 Transcript_11860/m.31678 type:complete len:305 (-) Transcript_11860:657-1571(-)